MAFGLTTAGFIVKRLADLVSEMKADVRALLGEALLFDETSPETQLVGAISDRDAELWEGLEGVYNSQSPDTAEGTALDKVGSLNLLARFPATKSQITMRLLGDIGTLVPATTFEASVEGNSAARFQTTEDADLETPYNAKNLITFSDTPAAGHYTLITQAGETGNIAWNGNAAAVQAAMVAMGAPLTGNVTVTGNSTIGFTVEYTGGLAAQNQDILVVGANTVVDGSAAAIEISVAESQIGGYGDDVAAEALTTGPLAASAGTLKVIETATTGVVRVTNPNEADIGSDIETDAAFRLRRQNSLQRSGTAALEGIRNAVAQVSGVDTVFGFENVTDTVDGEGRPGKSVEMVVQGGDDDAIGLAIWLAKAGGIETYGTETATFDDSLGISRTIKFSRPSEVNVYMTVEVTPNTDPDESEVYPVDGDDQVAAAVLAFGLANQPIGRDVIVTRYFIPVNTVPGVNGIVIKAGLAPTPTLSANLVMTSRQRAIFDAARIVVNS